MSDPNRGNDDGTRLSERTHANKQTEAVQSGCECQHMDEKQKE